MAGSAFRKPGVEITPLSRETLQDRVYRHVTELILDGSIVPGEMVTVQSLADAFGVSPMPVREALRRLTAANALMVVSGRSIGIPALSRARLIDLRNVRFEIEAIAAVEGVDSLFIGRGDLTAAYGDETKDPPAVVRAVERISEAARKAKKNISVYVGNAQEAAWLKSHGASVFILSSDQGFLRQAAMKGLGEVRDVASK